MRVKNTTQRFRFTKIQLYAVRRDVNFREPLLRCGLNCAMGL
jgi:hypothetical protein